AVPGGPVEIVVPGLGTQLRAAVGDFFIDRHEVTNAEYRAFVDAGGYRRPELWRFPFMRDGAAVAWADAMAAFHDSTGRPRASTRADGTCQPGQENFPVGGVSFYEAAAYAELAGKSLPTMYHFSRAAQTDAGTSIIVGSRFDAPDPVPVEGAGAMSGFGTYDM